MITGRFARFRIRRHTSKPSIPGSPMSRMAKATARRSSSQSPSSPVRTMTAWKPSRSSAIRTRLAMFCSSSMTRIVVSIVPSGRGHNRIFPARRCRRKTREPTNHLGTASQIEVKVRSALCQESVGSPAPLMRNLGFSLWPRSHRKKSSRARPTSAYRAGSRQRILGFPRRRGGFEPPVPLARHNAFRDPINGPMR